MYEVEQDSLLDDLDRRIDISLGDRLNNLSALGGRPIEDLSLPQPP